MIRDGFFGVVEDVNDPEKRCRIKARVFSKMENLSLEFIPWAEPDINMSGGDSSGGGNYALPKVKTLVFIYYINDDFYHPYWKGIPIPSEKLIEFVGEDYTTSVSLFYDYDLNTGSLMIPSKGILNFYKNAIIQIRNDETILLKTSNQTIHINDTISLGSENSSNEPAVLGDTNEDVLKDILKILNKIVSLLENYVTNQASSAGANIFTATLVPNLSKLLAETLLIKPNLKILETKIPKTKSNDVTLN